MVVSLLSSFTDADKRQIAKFVAEELLYKDGATPVEKQVGAYLLCYVLNARITNKYENAKWMQLAVEYSEIRKNKTLENGEV